MDNIDWGISFGFNEFEYMGEWFDESWKIKTSSLEELDKVSKIQMINVGDRHFPELPFDVQLLKTRFVGDLTVNTFLIELSPWKFMPPNKRNYRRLRKCYRKFLACNFKKCRLSDAW